MVKWPRRNFGKTTTKNTRVWL